MEKLLSIIISVYNKEKYLSDCIESLVNLNIDKTTIEAIFVDDFSSDNSRDILTHYSAKYDFIKSIQLDNNTGSPATPRNTGISEAKGKYLTILDADDWLDYEGFPQLLFQMEENNSDIGFGQCFKHTNSSITKTARFASYKTDNYLLPYEIEKIFRAVGPPGKIFKKNVVDKYNIRFKHMPFAEDKLFFIQLISNCKRASMSTVSVYHINRYKENASLVTTTNSLEKANINLKVLGKVLEMEIPPDAKQQVIHRIIEVDFMRRFFHTKKFLKSLEKDTYYHIFNKVIDLLNKYNLDITDFISKERFKNIFELYINYSKHDFIEYLSYLVIDEKKSKFISDGVIQKQFPEKYNTLLPVPEECVPIYLGTHKIEDNFFEVIDIYKLPNVQITSVLISKISDERFEKEVAFNLKDNKVYIRTQDLIFDELNINFRIKYDNYKNALTYSSFPNASINYLQVRQDFKTELKKPKHNFIVPTENYISLLPEYIVALKQLNCYNDKHFKSNTPTATIEAGSRVKIKDIVYTELGTPRLVTTDNLIITANKKYVKVLNINALSNYLTEKVEKVEIIKECKVYTTRSFDTEPLATLTVGEEMPIKDIVYTNKLTPRLKTLEDHYITANLKFVDIEK